MAKTTELPERLAGLRLSAARETDRDRRAARRARRLADPRRSDRRGETGRRSR